MDIQTLNSILESGAQSRMTLIKFLEKEIKTWKNSPERQMMLKAEAYYKGDHDIINRKRQALGQDGTLTEVAYLPNNKIIDNQYANAVDKKVNYSFARPFSADTDNKNYAAALNDFFTQRFRLMFKSMAKDALNGGLGWLHPYYGPDGTFRVRRFRPSEILPFWLDEDHTELDAYARVYEVQGYEGDEPVTYEKVDFVDKNGILHLVFYEGALVPDATIDDEAHYMAIIDGKEQPQVWERIPLIAFKYNAEELSLLKRVKVLQDAINTIVSDFMNNMQEDARNTILVIENYDGQDLAEFRHNLSLYGAVKVSSVDGAKGDVRTLTVEVNKENYQAIYQILKEALVANAKNLDSKDDKLGSNPNQMNIQSMYSDIDIDANGLEAEFQAGFEELLWFINMHLANSGVGDFEGEKVKITFNRDILMNESQAITDCKASLGLISKRTIVANHPWVTDVEDEMAELDKETAAAMAQYSTPKPADPTQTGTQGGGVNGQ